MKYFLPEWDDKVDPKYEFLRDKHSESHKKGGDVYLWDIFGPEKVPIDGLLLSRMTLVNDNFKETEKCRQILIQGVHKYYHFFGEVLGDCGAWGYIEEERPPFESKETLEYYMKSGFDYGTSIDHLILPQVRKKDPKEGEKRFNLVINNARDMYDIWQSEEKFQKSVRLIGIAQGWDATSYRKAVREILQIGYDYIGIGGIAKYPSEKIIDILRAVSYEVQRYEKKKKRRIDLHLFGVARLNIIPTLTRLGVSSIDSAGPLRRAWLGRQRNYKHFKGEEYAAIRVRFLSENDPSKGLEKEVLSALRLYDEGRIQLDKVLMLLEEFEEKTGGKVPVKDYRRTLEDEPWKHCECPICSDLKIEVMIFRGNNRNRRRGFHNVFAFHSLMHQTIPRILVFTNCSATKDPSVNLLPAYLRYAPSSLFKAFWNQVYDLPVEIKILSAKFGLIDCHKMISYYDYKMKEKDVERYAKDLEKKLSKYQKIFFYGLGLYRKAVEKVISGTQYPIEIMPDVKFTNRNKVDVIEYAKQTPILRQRILEALPKDCRPQTLENKNKLIQKAIEEFVID